MTSRRTFLLGSLGAAGASLADLRAGVKTRIASRPQRLPTVSDYGLDPKIAYLNHASIGTVPRIVQAAHHAYLVECETNPAAYVWGDAWEEALADVRESVATKLGCKTTELALTHNTTEGFNTLAHGLDLGSDDEVLFSTLNHVGASACWERVGKQRGYQVRRFVLAPERAAALTEQELIARHVDAIEKNTKVLVLPHIDNLIGVRVPLKELIKAVKAAGVRWVAVDGAQSAGAFPVNLRDSGADFYAASPHKWLQAPKGLGVLYCRDSALEHVQPMWTTWGQERYAGTARIFEDYGTRDLAKVLSLGDALQFHARTSDADRTKRTRELWNHAKSRTVSHESAGWASPVQWELASGLYSIRVRGEGRKAMLDQELPKQGLVFRAFHRQDDSLVRLSPNVFQTTEDLDRFFDALPA